MTDAGIAALTAIVTALCTAIPILVGQYFRHKEEMRKLDEETRKTDLARQSLMRKVSSFEHQIANVQVEVKQAADTAKEVQDQHQSFMVYLETGGFQIGGQKLSSEDRQQFHVKPKLKPKSK